MWLIKEENNEEITDKQGILNTWQKYVEELYETRNRPTILDIENETNIRRWKGTSNYYGRRGAKVDWDFRSLTWSKTLMELIFNQCGEFRRNPEGPVSWTQSPHLHDGAPGIFSDFLRSVLMLKREWGEESNGKLPHLFVLSKTAALVSEFAVEDLPWAELQPRFLLLQWRTCPWAEHWWCDLCRRRVPVWYYGHFPCH